MHKKVPGIIAHISDDDRKEYFIMVNLPQEGQKIEEQDDVTPRK